MRTCLRDCETNSVIVLRQRCPRPPTPRAVLPRSDQLIKNYWFLQIIIWTLNAAYINNTAIVSLKWQKHLSQMSSISRSRPRLFWCQHFSLSQIFNKTYKYIRSEVVDMFLHQRFCTYNEINQIELTSIGMGFVIFVRTWVGFSVNLQCVNLIGFLSWT